MSQQNLDIVRRAYEGVSARLEPPRELFGPDYEVDASDVAPDFGVLRDSKPPRNPSARTGRPLTISVSKSKSWFTPMRSK